MFCKIRFKKVAAGFAALVSLVFGLSEFSPVYAQAVGATLSGTVTDPSGAVVPKTAVSIKNIATGITRASTTDPAGFYSAPNLLPVSDEITVAAPGFSSEAQDGIPL